jgi:hypothetical protein
MDKESKGSKSSSTQETIANFFPQYRGLKPAVWILGIVFEDGRIHTIHPPDLSFAKIMLERMLKEVEKKLGDK